MSTIASVILLQLVASVISSDSKAATDSDSTVMVSAGGSFIRREADTNAEHVHLKHEHHPRNVKAMFEHLDRNGDGLITTAELKEVIDEKQYHSATLASLLAQATATTGTTFADFKNAVHRAASLGALHSSSVYAAVHHHKTASGNVTCGGHKAESCAKCTTTDAHGATVMDHGAEWCNGDCVFNPADDTCHPKASVDSGDVTISGTANVNGTHSTTPVPDLLNPNKTATDQHAIDEAAKAALKEEELEAKEKEEREREEEEKKKFSWDKFWLIVIVTFSVILGICMIVSCVAAIVIFCKITPPGEEEKDVDDDGQGFVDAGAEATEVTADES